MRKPQHLKKGDTIAIVSSARAISKYEINFAIQTFESWGLKVILGKTIGAKDHQFAGNDELRTKDFQAMLDNKDIKAIVCARGGYGSIRIIENLDFTQFMHQPKWIVGYSDITILHAHINTYLAVQTIHATMPINFETNTGESIQTLKEALFGKKLSYEFASNQLNKKGKVTGEIVGGNLSILYSILGTKSGFNPDHKILFIEDLDEMLYHIDRMVIALKKASKFNKIQALLVGGMSDMRDNTKEFGYPNDNPFGKTPKEIILDHCQAFDFPICFDFPAGHLKENNALIFGKKTILEINEKVCKLTF
jgi:muramoyltetrapeptide carboxypeptidase